MDSPFTYNTYVTGTDFISRHQELDLFINLVRQKQHILIYEPPKSGKHSLIQQGLIKLRQEGYSYTVCKINLFNVRTQKHLLYKVFDSLLDTFCSSPQEREEVIAEINSGIAGVFGEGEVKYETATDPIPDAIAEQILNMPEFMANKYNTNPVIYLEEFQELLLLDDNYYVLKLLEKILQSHTASTYIITGSQVNAMKEIFEVQRFFYNFAERIKLGRIDKKSFTDFIIRSNRPSEPISNKFSQSNSGRRRKTELRRGNAPLRLQLIGQRQPPQRSTPEKGDTHPGKGQMGIP